MDDLIFANERGQALRRGNFTHTVPRREAYKEIGVSDLHLHDLRHTGNTLAAQSGASLRGLMTRMGHDSPAAALIYQHSSRVANEGIAAALDAHLNQRLSRQTKLSSARLGPVEGPESLREITAKKSDEANWETD